MKHKFSSRLLFALGLVVVPLVVASCSGKGGARENSDGDGDDDGSGASGSGTGGELQIDLPISMGGDDGTGGGFTACLIESDECHYEVVDAGPACGDGNVDVDEGETCDDGNTFPGDGCTGICEIEPNSLCPDDGGPCMSTIVCGDESRGPGESCDDGNNQAGDGCSATCRSEPGFYCPVEGESCTELVSCGDGLKQSGESCDDKNENNGDGCSDLCAVESGWRCIFYPTGMQCEELPVCGNGEKEGTEECDDSNSTNGDGCSASCKVEASYWNCATPGVPCVSLVSCGDGRVEDRETCDDSNNKSGDGCSAQCRTSSGWTCPAQGEKCVPKCGDGMVISGVETCDDSDKTSGDGCSSTCQREPGYVCAVSGSTGGACEKTTCGDGIVEGGEQCDRGALNGLMIGDPTDNEFPGCTLACTDEPSCRDVNGKNVACEVTCGDGVHDPSEGCDDGNRVSSDGCSASCAVEAGFTCDDVTVSDTVPCPSGSGQCLVLPVVYRDFKSHKFSGGHSDFFYIGTNGINGVPDGICTGVAGATLNAQGKPTLARTNFDSCNSSGYSYSGFPLVSSATSFSQWYTDSAFSKKSIGSLTLSPLANGTYRYAASGSFYPLDNNMLWSDEQKICSTWPYQNCNNNPHNYHFTSEVRYLFPYNGGETLTFLGDDDVWVYVNGQRAVDLGGTHQEVSGSVTLTGNVYGMTPGNIYEIVVFQAERHPIASNYTLTLAGFDVERSDCKPTCGDGVATITEECDNGVNNGSYGTCNDDCTFAPRCGDGKIQLGEGETCDDGVNQSVAYNAPPPACGPGCQDPPSCGDGVIHGVNGELCDDGEDNSDDTYGACSNQCSLGAFCGDGRIQSAEGEECDDGLNLGGYGQCDVGCKLGPRCGDGVPQPGESCDDGNEVSGDGCEPGCGLAALCGDGIIQPEAGEQCDDGVNDGSYGGCSVDCLYGPRCGDGVAQKNLGEECDLGDDLNSNTLYGGCTTTCQAGPHCGDGTKQSIEQCDDGNNSSNDGCSNNCLNEVLVVR